MKKHFKQIIALCLVSMMVLASCNRNNVEPETTEATTTIETEAASTTATTEESTVVTTEADTTTAPESTSTTAVETTAEATSTEETTVSSVTTAPETTAPETTAPETTLETTVESTTIEETSIEETTVEETSEDTSEEITEAPTEETSEVESETETEAPTTEAPTTSSNPLDKYKLGFGSDMDMSEFDPVKEHATVTAPQDDPDVFYWFDHITEKVDRYTINQNGRQNYTIQMAKNEVEGCQFFLYAPTQRKINVKISDFANSYGETLKTELGVEFYMEDGYVDMHFYGNPVYPDAVVPYESYISKTEGGYYEEGAWVSIGPYSPKTWDLENYPYKDTSRGFVVQATTTPETRTGEYMATIEIYDAETGDCIKMMNLYTYVYNVTLSEETAQIGRAHV